MQMTSHTPIPRLRHFAVGDRVKLPHDEKTIYRIEARDSEYVDLFNGQHLAVTASLGHVCERAK
jgi:hypothetical protein